jgi:hypothetical protein
MRIRQGVGRRSAEKNPSYAHRALENCGSGVPVRTVANCFSGAREEDTMTGAHIQSHHRSNGKSGCPEDRWNAAHRKFVIRLHTDQATQMEQIAKAANCRPSKVVAELIAFALEKLVCEKKRKDFERSCLARMS